MRRGSDRIIGGVCSGLAVYFAVDPLLIRVVFVILALVPPSIGILLYLVLWFLMEPPQGAPAPTTTRSFAERLRAMGDDIRQDFRTGFSRSQGSAAPPPASGDPAGGPPPSGPPSHQRRWGSYGNRPPGLWAGIILIVLGAYFLATNLGVLSNLRWDLFWPAVLILLGLLLLVRRR